MVDSRPRLRGDFHAASRRDDRQRRAARHPALAPRQPLEPAVGGRRLLADARLVPAHRGQPRRPARAPAGVHDRLRHLHLRLVPVRDQRRPDAAEPLPRAPGRRRRRHVRHLAGADRPGVPGQRPGDRVRRLGRDGRRRGRGRTADRRRDHRELRLGVDLLRQRPDRDRRDGPDRAESSQRLRRKNRNRSTSPAWSPSPPRSSSSSSR